MEIEEQRQKLKHLPPQAIYFSQLQSFTPCILTTSVTGRVGNRWLLSAPKCSSLQLLPAPHIFLTLLWVTYMSYLHSFRINWFLHSFRINLFQHVSSMGHSLDVYSDVVVSTGCNEIFAHLHRLLSVSGKSALA